MKVITLCGSLKFQKEMMIIAEKMALNGNCILTPVYPMLENREKTEEQIEMLKEAHLKRIELSNAILVNYDKAISLFQFENNKQLLKKANDFDLLTIIKSKKA